MLLLKYFEGLDFYYCDFVLFNELYKELAVFKFLIRYMMKLVQEVIVILNRSPWKTVT